MRKRDSVAELIGKSGRRESFQRYLQASYSTNTKLAYEQDVAHFRGWGGRLPATAETVARYLAAHAEKLAYATLSRRLAGIHREHVTRGLVSPIHAPVVRATLRGIGRTHSKQQRRKKPVSTQQLQRMLARAKGLRGLRDKALLLIGFFGGFRRSELAQLRLEDLTLRTEGLVVHLRSSKTDQEGEGRDVPIPKLQTALCPVTALVNWLRASAIARGPLFRRVTAAGTIGKAALSGEAIAGVVKHYIGLIGMDPAEYGGHSLRAGLVTAAAAAGAANWQIKKQTGQKSDATLAIYIRDAEMFSSSNVAELVGKRRRK